jgi:hypothetical protein
MHGFRKKKKKDSRTNIRGKVFSFFSLISFTLWTSFQLACFFSNFFFVRVC